MFCQLFFILLYIFFQYIFQCYVNTLCSLCQPLFYKFIHYSQSVKYQPFFILFYVLLYIFLNILFNTFMHLSTLFQPFPQLLSTLICTQQQCIVNPFHKLFYTFFNTFSTTIQYTLSTKMSTIIYTSHTYFILNTYNKLYLYS